LQKQNLEFQRKEKKFKKKFIKTVSHTTNTQSLQQHAQHSWITFSLYVIAILANELGRAAWGAVEVKVTL
jgi:hypothetical protein